jgi:hypothetical protein
MSRWGETFAALSGGSDTLDTIRHSGDPLSIVSQSVNSVTAAPTPSVPSIPPAVDRALAIWGEAEAERAVIVGDEGAKAWCLETLLQRSRPPDGRASLPEKVAQTAKSRHAGGAREAGLADKLQSSEPGCAVRGSAARQVLAGGIPDPSMPRRCS